MQIKCWIVMLLMMTPLTVAQNTRSSSDLKTWWPRSGSVMLCGGAVSDETAKMIEERLVALAGGPEATIVIIPTAWDFLPAQLPTSGAQPKEIESLRRQLESHGAHHVVFMHTKDRKVADTPEFARVLRSAKGVFFPGGKPLLIENTYHGTLVERELKALLDRGGVIAGDSAGALAIGVMELGWNPDTYAKLGDGLGILPHVTVSCHANAARGFVVTEQVLKYFSTNPPEIGIVIDENTVLVLKGSTAEVFGQRSVAILDPTKDESKRLLRLAAGERRDFAR